MSEHLICPYPGLRPFNEDEAIFFKGREEHIDQIVKQLEAKKFLMLTGASGDGKSSLVYAGVIPNARAGFFKAKFNNWVIADFRPERDPLKNFATSISQQLKLNDISKIEKELSYGFSALIDLYKSSSFWVNQDSPEFKSLPETDQKKAKRKGANLMILVDQFEEFFTNPENYSNGKSSIESQAVVNILLETTRLAIEQNIPIYIVCTMRSDYIGQCASFRGLPEYIGYSQFFVPRLKRKEIYQVIEEPAMLNGNKISKRLVEMLINEMNDGIDQLPVLQHALNQIWQKADKGTIEMDLIHFAKIGGVPKAHLTEKDREDFEHWFEELPDFKKTYFDEASLENVLDTHANELYENAESNINNEGAAEIVSAEDAKLIVKVAFKCLTKIDEARAVRNRMTLEEVTNIINKPHLTEDVVASVLKVFRKQGNTFLKPFITEDADTQKIDSGSVLDITHESLIRNWQKLTDWAQEEYESLLTWQDFNKQLQRYISNKRSSGYLLPIGPLTFFETWFNTVKPNKHWFARYDNRDLSKEQKLADAEKTLTEAYQFIKRSARRLFFSRTVLKYGADKIIAVFGLIVLLFGCAYFYFDFRKKQNDYVVADIQEKSQNLLKSRYIKNKVKAQYILTAERLNPGTFKDLLKNIESDSAQIDVAREMFSNCLSYQEGKKEKEPNNPLVGSLFLEQLNLIESKEIFKTNASLIRNINNVLGAVYGHIILKRNNFPINDNGTYEKFCNNAFKAFVKLLADHDAIQQIQGEEFNKLLQAIPEIVNYDNTKLNQVIGLLGPFNPSSKATFDILYPKDKTVKQNWSGSITHNAGYYQLCNLFALTNDFDNLNRSFDSLMINNKNFLNITYGYSYERLLHDLIITGRLFSKEGREFTAKIESKLTVKNNYPIEVMMLNKLLSEKTDIDAYTIRHYAIPGNFSGGDLQLQNEKISYTQLNDLAEDIINNFLKSNKISEDEKNYMAALLYKAKAFANNKKENLNYKLINENIEKALGFYDKISESFLKGDINLGEGAQIKTVQRSKVFKYPGLVQLTNGWDPFGSYYSLQYKDKSVFINYILDSKGLANYYNKNTEDAEVLNAFLLNYYSITDLSSKSEKLLDIKPFCEVLSTNTLNKKIDKDALLAFVANYYMGKGMPEEAVKYVQQINYSELLNKEKIKKENNEYLYYNLARSLINSLFRLPYQTEYDSMELLKIKSEHYYSAFVLLKSFPDAFQRRNALLANIDSLQRGKRDLLTICLVDTMLNSYVSKDAKFGNKLFEVLGRLSTNSGDAIAMKLMKDKPDNIKPFCLNYFVNGKAQSNNYYRATTFIPEYISSSSQLELYTTILKNEIKKLKLKNEDGWSVMDGNESDSWTTGAYENGENSGIYYSSED